MKLNDITAEVSAELASDISARKQAYEQSLRERDEELANLRYSEDYYGCMYPAPATYALTCGCVFDRHRLEWTTTCEGHE